MTYNESRKILHGDVSGLEFMTDEVYAVCMALIDIVEQECCYYHHDKEIEWADAFITSYDHFKEDHNA